jgi:hypothetical protein
MKSPIAMFKRDPAAALARDRRALETARRKLAQLQEQRGATLLETDGYEATWALDKHCAEQAAAIGILESRIKALGIEVRRAERDRMARERDTILQNVIQPRFEAFRSLQHAWMRR